MNNRVPSVGVHVSVSRRIKRRAGRLRRQVREPVMVVALAGLVEVGVRCGRLPPLARLLGVELRLDGASPAATRALLPWWTVESVRATDALYRRVPLEGTCLRRALVLGHRLRRLSPVLRIGVRPADPPETGIQAHAWLEIDGASLDPSAARYATLEGSLPCS